MGTRCCHHIFMCHKYHVKHISKQCNLDRLKSGSKRDTSETPTCAVPMHAPCPPWQTNLFVCTNAFGKQSAKKIQKNRLFQKKTTKKNVPAIFDFPRLIFDEKFNLTWRNNSCRQQRWSCFCLQNPYPRSFHRRCSSKLCERYG